MQAASSRAHRHVRAWMPTNPKGWNETYWPGGCVRRTLLDCKSGTDEFKRYFNVKLPNTQTSWFNMGMALQACEAEYLKNCTCMAYANTNITGETSGCLLWFRHSVTSYTCPTETTGLIRKLSTLLRNIILNLNF
ncbi:putative non-specific serine/threonine protein kinase [Helianthus anomalus]